MAPDEGLRQRLRRLFQAELEDAIEVLNAGLMRLEDGVDAGVADLVAELFRAAHSVKGAALSADVTDAVGAARRLEEGLALARDAPESLRPEMIERFLAEVDALTDVAASLGAETAGRAPEARGDVPAPGGAAPAQGSAGTAGGRADPHSVRVTADAVEDLVSQTSELVAAAGRSEDLARALAMAAESEEDRRLSGTVDRLRRTATQTAQDLARVTAAVTAGVERLTLQPFADACAGLDRAVRDLAHTAGKKAHLSVEGGAVEVDRAVAARLREPLLHLVRNAVDHGLETPDERRAGGKPETGTVTITAELREGKLTVTARDDGRGVDRGALRRATGSQRPEHDEEDLALAFAPGVSTAATVTDVSGRGVGLDAVQTQVEAIGGTARLDSTPGGGTTVTLTCPVNLALMRVLLVQVAGETVALPTAGVARLVTVDAAQVQQAAGQRVVQDGERSWPVRTLAGLFGDAPVDGDLLRVALVEAEPAGAALAVDGLVDEREVIVRPLPTRLSGVGELLGLTVLPEGTIVLVLHPVTCARHEGGAALPQAADGTETAARPRVVLAEDTMTTRVLQEHILQGAGYEVTTAVDGAEAWAVLQRQGADVVVSDVHMPRMDGIELCRAIRRSGHLTDVPVVLVTSLGSEEDRRRGVEAGADAYIVKAEFEAQALLDAVERLL